MADEKKIGNAPVDAPVGIRSTSSAATFLNRMKYQPIMQKQLAAGIRQEGYDNKAVSQYDRMVGKQVAGERARLIEVDRVGDDLAMRKDKLAFAKKIQGETQKLAEEEFEMNKDKFGTYKTTKTVEAVLGAASVPLNLYRAKKAQAKDKEYFEKMEDQFALSRDFYGIKRKPRIDRTLVKGNSFDETNPSEYDYDVDYGEY